MKNKTLWVVFVLFVLTGVFSAKPLTESLLLNSVNNGRIGKIGLFKFNAESVEVNLLDLKAYFKNVDIRLLERQELSAQSQEIVITFFPVQWMKGVKDLNIDANKVDFYLAPENFQQLKIAKVKFKDKKKKKRPPLDLKLDLRNVRVYRTLKTEKLLPYSTLKQAEGTIRREFSKLPLAIEAKAITQGNGEIKFHSTSDKGKFDFHGSLINIQADEIQTAIGEKKMPIQFDKGNFNAEFDVKTQNGDMEGIIIPKVENLRLVEKKKTGFFKKIGVKIANAILKDQKDKQITTIIPFTFKGKLEVDFSQIVKDLSIE